MTVKEWAQAQSGVTLKVPAGTVIKHVWYYKEDGEWTKDPKRWVHGMEKEYRAIPTTKDQLVELKINGGSLEAMALKAIGNRTGRSNDGPLTMKRIR